MDTAIPPKTQRDQKYNFLVEEFYLTEIHMRHLALKIASIFALCAALTGCEGLGLGGYDPQAWFAHQARNNSLQEWRIFAQVRGTIPDANQTRYAFEISWLQKNDVFDVYLITPGSSKADAHILGKPDAAEVFIFEGQEVDGVLEIAVKERYEGSNVDQLVLEKLDLPLPVSGLVHWLRGLEKPSARGASFISIGNQNRLDSLMQDGWEVTYQSYGEHEGYLLPERIKLASRQFNGFVMEMNITRWQFRDFDKY